MAKAPKNGKKLLMNNKIIIPTKKNVLKKF